MSVSSLRPLDDAIEHLLDAACTPSRAETVALDDALGRVLAEDQFALIDVPPADNSAMDGYAVRARDAGRQLRVSQRIAAGDVPLPLAEDSVARIFTGASIPDGADAVVMQEDVTLDEDLACLPDTVGLGQHIRRLGQDCARGELLLSRGRRLKPQDLGLLASQGHASLELFPRLTVALLSTGSELREADGGELPPGAIFNSNRPMLRALLSSLGCAVVDMGIVEDTAAATRETLANAARQADVVLSSGGVSVGEADHVRDAVNALGNIDLWRIAIKPGKPFAHGLIGGTPFLGLPGNPASAFVTFVLLARPFLCALQGRTDLPPRTVPARADFSVDRPGSRREYLRVTLRNEGDRLWAVPYANQSSGILRSVSASDALAVVPERATVQRGDTLTVLPLESLIS